MAKAARGGSFLQAGRHVPADPRRFGFAEEYDVERKFRETRLYQIAPISTNLVLCYLAEHCSACRARTRRLKS